MALSKEEREQLEALQAKEKAPPEGRQERIAITIDLSDPAAVKRGMALGYITAADLEDDAGDDDDDDAGDDDDDDGDDGKRKKKDPAPKRRLSMADRTLGSADDD